MDPMFPSPLSCCGPLTILDHMKVRRLSAGRCGYIHLPDMERMGWSEFERHIFVEGRKEGLLLDVRSNGGGMVSEQVLMRLS